MNDQKMPALVRDKPHIVLRDLAIQLKLATDGVSPFIQQITNAVCPSCEKVCCIDRHGRYDENDLIYIRALGLETPTYQERPDTEPCQFLSEFGCTRERSVRPFRCNWYFCNALLEYLEQSPQKPYREFIASFQKVVELRNALLEEYKKTEEE